MVATIGGLVAAAWFVSTCPDILLAAKAAQGSAKNPAVREELVLRGTPAQLKNAYYSLSSRRLITIQTQGGKETLSGVPEAGEYDSIGRGEFTPDGLHSSYMASRNKRLFALLDGKEVGDHENVDNVDNVTLSPDGRRLAFYAWKDKQWVLVVDGKEGPASQGVSVRDFSPPIFDFSPDSRRLAYVTGLGKGKVRLIVDGVPAFDGARADIFEFSPDSQHWAAIVLLGSNQIGVLFDGKMMLELPLLDIAAGLRFNPVTGKVATMGIAGKNFFQVGVHQMRVPEKHEYTSDVRGRDNKIAIRGPYFSADGKHDVYAIHDSRGDDVFADGEIVFSSRKTGFLSKKLKYERLEELALSADGRHLAVVASDGDRVGIWLFQMGMEAASGRWVPLGRREIEIPVPGLLFASSLVLSPTGQHMAFKVYAKEYDFVVVDGEEGPHYESLKDIAAIRFLKWLPWGCFFEAEDSVAWAVVKPDGLYRVTQRAPSTSPWPVLTDP